MQFKLVKTFTPVYANSLDAYIPEIWAQESVQILVENMVIANLIHRDFSNEVAKFGDMVHTRKPAEFKALRKTNADDVTDQDATATDILVPLDQHFHTSFVLKDGEESKSFKNLRDEYLEPAVVSIAREVDLVLLGECHQFWQNGEGLAGLITASNVKAELINTRKRMNINKAHEAGRNLILTPDTEAAMLNLDTFTEADKVGDNGSALREASLGRKFQFNMFMAQNSPSTIGTAVGSTTMLVDLAAGYPIGTTVVHIDGDGSSAEVGQWVSFGGGSAIHQITALGTLVTEDIDITIDPPLRTAIADGDALTAGFQGLIDFASDYATGYAKELVLDGMTGTVPVGSGVQLATVGTPNVLVGEKYSVIDKTDSSGNLIGVTLNKPLTTLITDDDVILFTPPANHNFAFHKNALALVSRPLAPAPSGLALSSVASFGGIGIRVTITYDGKSQGTRVTVDLLCGIEVLDLNLGAVLLG